MKIPSLKKTAISTVALICSLSAGFASASESDPAAYELMQQVKFRADGDSRKSDITMTLTSKDGFERVRHITMLETDEGQDSKSMVYVSQPADVAGTGVMLHAYEEASDRDDDIWIYIPAMKKVKRLSSKNKRGRFVSSEMSFADLERLQLQDFRYQLDGNEVINGVSTARITGEAANDNTVFKTGYTSKVSWVDPARHLIIKEEYFDEQGHHIKTMSADTIELIDGFWTVTSLHVNNVQTGDVTQLKLNSIDYNLPVKDAQFSMVALKRGL